jgi:hypothetical protein
MYTPKLTRNFSLIALCLVGVALLVFQALAHAQPPGQDTVVITKPPNVSGGGGSPERPGKGLDEKQDMPIGLKAKIARYTALSMSKGEETQAAQTNSERAESAGFRKTCVQDIWGNTAPTGMSSGRYGPRVQDQVTVLRGDFINVCR